MAAPTPAPAKTPAATPTVAPDLVIKYQKGELKQNLVLHVQHGVLPRLHVAYSNGGASVLPATR